MKAINAEIEAAAQTAKDPTSYMAILEEKIKRKEEIYEKISNEIKPDLTLDTTLFTDTKLKFENPNKDKDLLLLQNMAKFLKEEIIEKFVYETVKEDDNIPFDSFSLTELLHKYGINIRYYGEILAKIEQLNSSNANSNNKDKENFQSLNKKNISWVKSLILRDMLRRSAKHLFNETTKSLPEYLVKEYSAYFLNSLLAPANLIKYLESYNIEYSNGSIIAQKESSSKNHAGEATSQENSKVATESKNKKKKNKKKKQKGEAESEYDSKIQLFVNDNLMNKKLSTLIEPKQADISKHFIKPSAFWKKIQEIIKIRYNYDLTLSENFENIESPINKYGLLRDFCLTVGLQIEAIEYELYYDNSTKNEFKYPNMPFKGDNIINFYPICKDFYLPSEIHKPLFEQAEAMLKSGNLLEAAEKYKQVIYLCNEVYGPINNFSAIAHKRLGEVSYLEGDIMNSIHLIQKSIIISEKLFDFDSNFVASAYAELSTSFHMIGQEMQAFKFLLKALEIVYFIYPRNVSFIVCLLAYMLICLFINSNKIFPFHNF